MNLPDAAKSYHTVWVCAPGQTAHPERYAVSDNRMVCFGDGLLASVPDGARVTVSLHEIAGGPVVASFGASFHVLPASAVNTEPLLELLAHVPLGRNLREVEASVERQRTERRIVELIP
ncbi:MAG: hypothetical protein ABJC79_05540 [Acidimicrobiia bacterium]